MLDTPPLGRYILCVVFGEFFTEVSLKLFKRIHEFASNSLLTKVRKKRISKEKFSKRKFYCNAFENKLKKIFESYYFYFIYKETKGELL